MRTPESIALGQYLKQRRRQLGEIMRQVADRCGLSKSYIAYIESGDRPHPSVHTIEKLAVGYKVDPDIIRRFAIGAPSESQLSRTAAMAATLERIEGLPPATQVEIWHLLDALVTHRERAGTPAQQPAPAGSE